LRELRTAKKLAFCIPSNCLLAIAGFVIPAGITQFRELLWFAQKDGVEKMKAIEVGTKCILLKGRRAGTQVTVTKIVDKNFVEIELKKGATVKKRKCNITHLEPLRA